MPSPTREQVDRVAERLYVDARQSGQNVSREQVRADVVKRAKRLDNKKTK
tara:strand:+ start:1312 stop:1461 length:150 start_codon:yes stop_codon:yes gene_type:complete